MARRSKRNKDPVVFGIGLLLLVFGGFKAVQIQRRDPSAPGYDGRVVKRETRIHKEYRDGRTHKKRKRYLTVSWQDQGQNHSKRFLIEKSSFYQEHPEGSQVRLARYGDSADDVELVQPSYWIIAAGSIIGGLLMLLFAGGRFLFA